MRYNWESKGIKIPPGKEHHEKVKVFCPQCHERRSDKRDKSLSCNLRTGLFKCHYCEWSGSVAEYSEEEKKAWMQRQPWYTPRDKDNKIMKAKKEYKKPSKIHSETPIDAVYAYFASRGISKEVVESFKITYNPKCYFGKDDKDQPIFELAIQFNYFLNNELVNVKSRPFHKKFRMEGGCELIPYNIDSTKGKEYFIITEGEFDALAYAMAGFDSVISVPNGAGENTDYLDRFFEDYFDDKEVIYIASDNDAKGLILRDELIRRFGPDRCKIVSYGEGCKDANDHLLKYGSESLFQTIDDAVYPKIDGVYELTDYEDALDSIFKNGLQRGLGIGHPNFDALCSFIPQTLSIVTGIPSSGKSEFIDEMCVRLNILHGYKIAYFSPENMPFEFHATKIIEKLTGRKLSQKRTSSYEINQHEYEMAKRYYLENFFHILPTEGHELSSILDMAKTLVRRKGIKVLVIDPFNYVENDQQKGETETQAIRRILNRLHFFAKQYNIMVFLMVHPTKIRKKDSDNLDGVPTPYDINGSAHFYNVADYLFIIHRFKEPEKYTLVRVAKVRFRHLGESGDALFKFNSVNGRYTPWDKNEPSRINYDMNNFVARKLNEPEQNFSQLMYGEDEPSSIPFDEENDEVAPF